MRLDRVKSSEETTEPAFSEHISLVVCPFLGMDEDPGTSLGFAHGANHCHGLGKAVGIELAHQNRYCLGENYPHCYVYAQSISESKPDKTAETGANPSPQAPENSELNSNQWITKRGLRVIGLLVMLLLIGVAAVIWWPPPGTSWQDFVALGSADGKDGTNVGGASLESGSPEASAQASLERPTASAVDPAGLVENSAAGEPDDQASAAVEKNNQAIDKQEKTAGAQLILTEKEAAALEEKKAAKIDEPELENLPANNEMVLPETASAEEEEPVIEAPAGTDTEESAAPAPIRQTSDPEQTEQVVSEEDGEQEPQEADIDSAVETNNASSTPAQSEATALEAAVMMTFIGPISNAAGLQGNSNSSPLLFLLSDPRDGAEVLAMIPERQSVTVLGRDSSGEWLMVRLSSGVEGWVRARESGAPIVVSNLPMADGDAGNRPVVQNPVSANAPAEVTQSPASGDGAPVFGTAVINSGALNLRSGPGLEYEPVGVAYNGQQVFLLEPPGSGVWVLVRLADGQQGWMNSNYLIQIRWAE